jgi:hypothetical protein
MQDQDDIAGLKRLLESADLGANAGVDRLISAMQEQDADSREVPTGAGPSFEQVEAARMVSESAQAMAERSAALAAEAEDHAALARGAYAECERVYEHAQAAHEMDGAPDSPDEAGSDPT